MRDEKFEASVPVCVEMVPTVMEFEVTPGAELADCAAAPLAVVVTMPATSAVPVSAVATSALNPCPTRMPSPIIFRGASPPGCRSL